MHRRRYAAASAAPAGRKNARPEGAAREGRGEACEPLNRPVGEKRRDAGPSGTPSRWRVSASKLHGMRRVHLVALRRGFFINYTPRVPRRISQVRSKFFGESVQARLSLTEGSIPPALLAFSLPILFGNVLQSVNGSVNAIWVGKYLGEAALAAVGNANVVMFLLFGVMFGFSMASTIMVAQCVGARNIAEAKRVVGTSAVFFLGLSLVMSLVGFALTQRSWPGCARRRMPCRFALDLHAHHFSGAALHGRIVLSHGGAARRRRFEDPFVYLSMAVALDIALNPLLIFGWGPVPRLGVAGSAIATLIAQA